MSNSLQDTQSISKQSNVRLENIKKQILSTIEKNKEKPQIVKKSRNNLVLSNSNNNKDLKDLLETKVRIHKTLKPYN
jgi:hypothetical protein